MYFAWRFGVMAAICAALMAPRVAAADQTATVDRTISIVRTGIAKRQDDKQIAKTLAKLILVQRLDAIVIEQMESEGAGPRTVEELARLAEVTAELPPPTPPPAFSHPPIPSRDEMEAAIHKARAYGLSYVSNLPNFLCDENIVRYEDLKGRGAWEKRDTLGVRLGFEDREEKDTLVSFNGKPSTSPLSSVAGARTSGEFGALMIQILDPASHGKFRWDHWTLLRNRPTQVYAYRINAADSHYKLVFGLENQHSETVSAMEGLLYLDGQSLEIVRIANHAAEIDASFPVRLASTTVDYAAQEIGGKRYVLPLRAEIRLSTVQIHTRNIIEFSGYRKFEGRSTITFGDPEPPPPGKIKH
jgi:hypothetical protein